ncbi:choice-of-anchor L domain-containing protein [Chryseobacterium sp. 3008163]|uniref:choice-of-anchor L domain-containing protein n=1 Tax=Chryseobacterium sp. 3008163 TaxID=2478663 RepID=UPI000F0C0B3A|nr:choice-of-anchor L domain-containing protein [Chryseobacterium sp. 3008163]AYM99505.1 gliding motility-associated C-terminal domain-containing protein [Chryseobacterium sp. 3008163]
MKRYLLLFSLFILNSNHLFSQVNQSRKPVKETLSANAKAGDYIDVNVPPYPESNFTPTQLVTDVLVGTSGSCGTPNISNVTVSPNQPVTNNDRFWGYFNKTTSTFPFLEGIVLTTGYARKAGNALENFTLSDGNTGGSDPDLAAAVGVTTQLSNAAILEFDFVPTSSQMKFRYIFASEEYEGNYPCPPLQFDDAFALLLKPNTPGSTYTNLAVLPGGAGPVSVPNILPASFACGPVNGQYFGSLAPNATNYNGTTAPLTAEATVIPGQSYHIKMVVADARDSSFGSAVFLEAGSFDIGVSLLDPAGAQLPAEINVCDNVPQVITASTSGPNLLYQWFFNGTAIPGANTNTITAIQPGNYKIEVSVPGNPCPGSATIKINGGFTPLAQDATFLLCSTPDITTFDLNNAKPLISPTPNATFRFYVNQADAAAQNNAFITNIANYNGADGQILYVVVSDGGFCSKTIELTLQKEVTPIAAITSSRIRVCPGETVTLTANGGVTYLWDNFPGNGNTQTVTVNQTTTFTVYALGAKGCKSLLPAKITVETVAPITTPLLDVEMCVGDTILLDAGAGTNYSYLWNTGAETQTITATQLGVYTVKINNGICEELFTVKVHGAASPFFTNLSYDNGTLTAIATNPSINNVFGTLEYSVDGINWQESNVFTNLTDNTTYNVQVRIKGTTCYGAVEFFTLEINNVITPNQDGVNDVLDLSNLRDFNNFTGSIYDRYGVEIFKFSKERPIWDGTISGKRLPTATYWYKFNFEYKKSKVQMNRAGWIMLKNRE